MKTIENFYEMKKEKQKIAMLTAYDYPSAKIVEQAKIDIILVGDSLGNVVNGKKSTIEVTLDNMIYHGQAVRRGAPETFIIADMPYMSYHLGINTTKMNAAKLMIEIGANAVKLEGGTTSRIDAIKAIVDCEIPVCGHLGLTPQSINMFGEFKVQAKTKEKQNRLLEEAKRIEEAGAFMLVLECVPEELGQAMSKALTIPVIGIGAGRFTDGQVLVWHDILGLSDQTPKFVKKYIDLKQLISQQVNNYITDVKEITFPNEENIYFPINKK